MEWVISNNPDETFELDDNFNYIELIALTKFGDKIVMAYRKYGNVHVAHFAINDTSNKLQIVMHKVAKTVDNKGYISLRLQTAPVNAIIISADSSFYTRRHSVRHSRSARIRE